MQEILMLAMWGIRVFAGLAAIFLVILLLVGLFYFTQFQRHGPARRKKGQKRVDAAESFLHPFQ